MTILVMGAFGPLASARAAGPTTISLSLPSPVQVGGNTIDATATVTDANGPVIGDTLQLSATGTNPPTFGTVVDNQDGTYTIPITSSDAAGQYPITVSDANGGSDTQTLTQTPGPASQITVSLSPTASIVADGQSSTNVVAQVDDQFMNPIPNEPVSVTTNGGQPIVAPTGNTNSNGVYATALTSTTVAGSSTITVTDTNPNVSNVSGTATLVQTPGPATQIQVQLSPTATITADPNAGPQTSVVATVYDQYMNPVSGDNVTVSSTPAGPGFSPASGTTNSTGTFTSQITATTSAGSYQITATDTSVSGVSSGPVTLTQVAGPASHVQVALSPYSSIVVGGGQSTTVSGTVTDQYGNPVSGAPVNITSTAGQTFAPTTTDSTGGYSAQITSTNTAGSYTITVTVGAASGTATLTQLPGPANGITVALSSPTLPADGHSATTATATVVDQYGNGVPGETITFAGGGQAIGPTHDNGDGTYSATITATTALGRAQITASDASAQLTSAPATLTQTLVRPFQLSLSLASPSLVADGSSQDTLTVLATDAVGHPLAGDAISVSDPSGTIAGASGVTNASGHFTAMLTSSLIPGTSTVTASDSTTGLSATAPLTQSAWLPKGIALAVAPSTITADGHSMATATITLTDPQGRPRVGDLSLSLAASDPKVFIGAISGHPDGTYTVPVTSSTAVGDVVLTAHEGLAGLSATTVLHQVHGVAQTLALALSQPVIRADGISTTTVTATIRDAAGNPVPGQLLHASTTDSRVQVGPISDHGDGTYTMQLTGSNHPGTVSVIVTDISAFPALSGEASLTQVPAPSLSSVVTMQWSFFYSRSYTRVLSLIVSGAPVGSTILVHCQGAGCPGHRLKLVAQRQHGCRITPKRRCATPATFGLGKWLKGRHLHTGTKLIVEVTRPGWIGKYYSFKVQPGKGPKIRITCLAPGGSVPGQACS